jgi:hypothetical protein
MAQGSAKVTATEIDSSGPVTTQPSGVPAGIVGTSTKGPAFVPVTVGNLSDFYDKFGRTDGKKFGPMAVAQWLGQGAGSVTYLRVLGVGDGKKRNDDGSVTNAGFVVGGDLPRTVVDTYLGDIDQNPYANSGGDPGRTYFFGTFMSESAGSTSFSAAGLQTAGDNISVPIIRGVLMAASGVILNVSSSFLTTTLSDNPSSTLIARKGGAGLKGSYVGDVVTANQTFVLLQNGHINVADTPNVLTCSLNPLFPDYFATKLNKDPSKIRQHGHCLYANWDIMPAEAVVTATGLTNAVPVSGKEALGVFLLTSSLGRDAASATVPNYESFSDRFSHAKSPWVISQRFGGKPVNLFRFHALSAGAGVSSEFKISIENLTPARQGSAYRFGSFDVIIRRFNDRDNQTSVLGKYPNLNLDPSSDRYISKVIGDAHTFFDFDRDERAQKLVVEGNYAAQSNYVRVEVDPAIELGTVDEEALPMGFRGIDHLVTSGSAPLSGGDLDGIILTTDALKSVVTPPLPFRTSINNGSVQNNIAQASNRLYWGVLTERLESVDEPNKSIKKNSSIESFTKYFPNYAVGEASFLTGSNSGQPDSAQLGIIDADRFCNNMFTLENVMVTHTVDGVANPEDWVSSRYSRDGSTPAGRYPLAVADLLETKNRRFAKFTMIMQGGFDGVNIFDRDSADLNDNAVDADMSWVDRGAENGGVVKAYTKALEILKNVVNVDIQLLAMPGIRQEYVTNMAAEFVRDRFDALYVMDIIQRDKDGIDIRLGTDVNVHVGNTISTFNERLIDNSFAAAYFPDVNVRDPNTGNNVIVPPSVVVLGALALNDKVGHPWFAPAGFTRGSLKDSIDAKVKLSQSDLDRLYDARINPIVSLQGSGGPIIWGQKTLQAAASALDRVNVRRLLIEIRRQVRDIAQTILFEPNRAATLARFSAAVTPRLARIQAQAGLERFSVVIDSSTTTQQDIENNTVRGKIFVQPTKSIEFVSLDFEVSNTLQ